MLDVQPRIVPTDKNENQEVFMEKLDLQLGCSIACREEQERIDFIKILAQNFDVEIAWIISQFNLWRHRNNIQ